MDQKEQKTLALSLDNSLFLYSTYIIRLHYKTLREPEWFTVFPNSCFKKQVWYNWCFLGQASNICLDRSAIFNHLAGKEHWMGFFILFFPCFLWGSPEKNTSEHLDQLHTDYKCYFWHGYMLTHMQKHLICFAFFLVKAVLHNWLEADKNNPLLGLRFSSGISTVTQERGWDRADSHFHQLPSCQHPSLMLPFIRAVQSTLTRTRCSHSFLQSSEYADEQRKNSDTVVASWGVSEHMQVSCTVNFSSWQCKGAGELPVQM